MKRWSKELENKHEQKFMGKAEEKIQEKALEERMKIGDQPGESLTGTEMDRENHRRARMKRVMRRCGSSEGK